jgi:hypothetical protein
MPSRRSLRGLPRRIGSSLSKSGNSEKRRLKKRKKRKLRIPNRRVGDRRHRKLMMRSEPYK